jgi:hypothetical protein
VTATPLDFPARPPSEVEWEELLVRLEITPRALRLAVDDAGGDSAALREVLESALGREWWYGQQLRELRGGAPVVLSEASLDTDRDGREPDVDGLAAAFAQLRERNFAQVQRRGLEVWDWESPLVGLPGTLTAYRLLQWMAHRDGETLAAVRAARRG